MIKYKKIKDLTDEEKDRICTYYCEDICYKCPHAMDTSHCHCKLDSTDKDILEEEVRVIGVDEIE